MALFNANHVRLLFSGHEHLFEHWVERYSDASGAHRMDLVVSGGGGAPIYTYSGQPDLDGYFKENEVIKTNLQHLIQTGVDRGSNPFPYVILHVDDEKLDIGLHNM